MMCNKIIMLFLMVPIASIHAMQKPERRSLFDLQKQRESRRILNQHEEERRKKIVEMIKESTGDMTRYRVIFSTGNVGICTHLNDGQHGPTYHYKEWAPNGAIVMQLSGQKAAINFNRYTLLHERWILESMIKHESRVNYLI